MSQNNTSSTGPSSEQLLYARILNKGMLLGIVILLITFAIYVFGIMDPYILVEDLASYWQMSSHDFLEHLEISQGWSWVTMLGYGDFLNFIGIAFLSGVTIICYAAIVPTLLRNNDKVYATLAVLEVLVLVLAAAGILTGGH